MIRILTGKEETRQLKGKSNFSPYFRSSYLKGRRVHGDWDIRVEQAQFQNITVSATSQSEVTVTIEARSALAQNGRDLSFGSENSRLLETFY